MLRPSIFGESLFDDWMDDFPFGKEFEKAMFPAKDPLYGKHARLTLICLASRKMK